MISLAWDVDSSGASTAYRLDRGVLGPQGFESWNHGCVADELLLPRAEDSAEPTPGEAFYYLALRSNCFGPGSAGSGAGGERPEGAACP